MVSAGPSHMFEIVHIGWLSTRRSWRDLTRRTGGQPEDGGSIGGGEGGEQEGTFSEVPFALSKRSESSAFIPPAEAHEPA